MSQSRYTYSRVINGSFYASREISYAISSAVQTGDIRCKVISLPENVRLDKIAFDNYGDSGYWWVIAAASGIGWGLQLPAGTVVRIPVNLDIVFSAIANVR
jgi:hypothetical protein